MSFIPKPDYFGLAATHAVKVKSSSMNGSKQRAVAYDRVGNVMASEEFGETTSPTVEYVAENGLADFSPVLGSITEAAGKKYLLTSVAVRKALGQAVAITCSGVEIPAAIAAEGCTCALPGITLPPGLHADIIGGAFALPANSGPVLNTCTECTMTFSCELASESVDGVMVAFDIWNPRMEVTATITQAGATAPSATPGTNWKETAPLSSSNPDADYPAWTVSYTQDLAVTEPA